MEHLPYLTKSPPIQQLKAAFDGHEESCMEPALLDGYNILRYTE